MRKFVWQYLSAFGICYALACASQEFGLLPAAHYWAKTVIAVLGAWVLYADVARKV